jgi:hypothetical protein
MRYGQFAIFCFQFSINLQFTIGIRCARFLAVRALQLVVDVVGLRKRAGGGFQMSYGFLDFPGVEQELAQLILGVAVVGMRGDDRAEKFDGFGLLGLLHINITETNFCIRIIGIQVQGSGKFLDGFLSCSLRSCARPAK